MATAPIQVEFRRPEGTKAEQTVSFRRAEPAEFNSHGMVSVEVIFQVPRGATGNQIHQILDVIQSKSREFATEVYDEVDG